MQPVPGDSEPAGSRPRSGGDGEPEAVPGLHSVDFRVETGSEFGQPFPAGWWKGIDPAGVGMNIYPPVM